MIVMEGVNRPACGAPAALLGSLIPDRGGESLMIVEIALYWGQGRWRWWPACWFRCWKPVVESEYLLFRNRLLEHAGVLRHAAGRLRDPVQRVHETVRSQADRSWSTWLAWWRGLRP